MQLTAMGISWLQLTDFDLVEESNLARQGYLENDLGQPKVQATADMCRQINPGLELYAINERFKRSMQTGNIVFVCVDQIETRRLIWEALNPHIS